jgi:nicotinate-nucleotide pyrophosphorylase (carboxylating)
MAFSRAETDAFLTLARLALAEDLGDHGDRTSLAVIPADLEGTAVFVARTPGVVAGLPTIRGTFDLVDARLVIDQEIEDGQPVKPGTRLASVRGPMRGLLTGERTVLNFLQRLSGVATLTRRYVDQVAGLPVQLLDTRKTTPGWRLLEKYAVRCGGGHNHRLDLADGVLIKDNHLAALVHVAEPVAEAVRMARAAYGHTIPLEIEVDTLDQLDRALASDPDIVLLDNMSPAQLREAVRRRDTLAPKVRLEASGGVNLTTIRAIAETGVDRISVGALTHSAVALDIGLDYAS